MLGPFGKKTLPEDTRAHYRRAAKGVDAIGVKLICANGAPVSGTLLDLSAGGCAVEFSADVSSDLDLDAVRELVFGSLNHGSIRAWGQVRGLPRVEGQNRYGFMFLETAELFEQLSEAFYKFFNRRRFLRAKPALGESLKAELAVGKIIETLDLHDISVGGAGLIIPGDIGSMLDIDMPVDLRVFVPKSEFAVPHHATVRHVSPDKRGLRVGFATEVDFSTEPKRQVKKAQSALLNYIQHRLDEIDRYNKAFH